MYEPSLWKIITVLIISIRLVQFSSAGNISFWKFTRVVQYDNMISTNYQLTFLVAKSLNHCGSRCSREGDTCKSFFFGKGMNLCHLYSEDVYNLSLTNLPTTTGAFYSRQIPITGQRDNRPLHSVLSTIMPTAVSSVPAESSQFLSETYISTHSEVDIEVSFTGMTRQALSSGNTGPVTLLQSGSSGDLAGTKIEGVLSGGAEATTNDVNSIHPATASLTVLSPPPSIVSVTTTQKPAITETASCSSDSCQSEAKEPEKEEPETEEPETEEPETEEPETEEPDS